MYRSLDAMSKRKWMLMASMIVILISCGGAVCEAQTATVGEARSAVGSMVTISDAVVTASFADAFWIESDNRSAGIKVTSGANPAVGKRVYIYGGVVRSDNEISIVAQEVTVGDNGTVPPPIGITGKVAVEFDKAGAAAQGLYVKVAGIVTCVDVDSSTGFAKGYYLDDGSGLSGDGTHKGLYVKFETDWKYPSNKVTENEFNTVTGVLTVQSVNSNLLPVVRIIKRDELSTFLAFNDFAWATLQPNTNITTYTCTTSGVKSGYLKDYFTGVSVPEKVTITGYGIVDTDSTGVHPNTGDVLAYFTVNGQLAASCVTNRYASNTTDWFIDVEFSGLNPDALYEYVCTANRGSSSYPYNTKYMISGTGNSVSNTYVAGNTVNGSSSGADRGDDGASTTILTSYNPNGYVARWYNIKPAADGTFKIRAATGSSYRFGYPYGVFRLQRQSGELTQ